MKFLIDAQLPRRLVYRLQEAGHEAIHTLDLPLGNRSPDRVINEISEREQRIVITKDADFVNSFTLYRKPYKLLLVSTGNIKNAELERLFLQNIQSIVEAFEDYNFVELGRTAFTIHE
jgi:predicted nuclease of predicted toxin-antitoxin system